MQILDFVLRLQWLRFHRCAWLSLQSRWQAVRFQMWWEREQEDAGSRAMLGWLLGFQRTHIDSVCLLPIPCVLLPVPNDLILLSLCNGEFQGSDDAVHIGPVPALNWKPGAKQLSSARGMKDVHCLPPAHVLCEAVMALHPPPLR